MADTFTTPFMDLELPTVNEQTGPEYAENINTALEAVDEHDHTSAKGKQVPTAGINIDADLDFNEFDILDVRAVQHADQDIILGTSVTDAIYGVSGDLYWNNGTGVAVQITSGAGLNFASLGTIGGDYGQPLVTAAVVYSDVTKVFSFTQASGVPAKMFFSDMSLAFPGSGSQSITFKATNSVVAYNLTFPDGVPSAQAIISMGTSGILTNPTIDATNFEIATNNFRLKDAGIATAKLQANAVTAAKIFAPSITNQTTNTAQLCTISNASPGVVTLAGHGLIADDKVAFQTTGSLPAPLTTDTTYYVKTVLGVNTFTLTATPSGAVINTTTAGSGLHYLTRVQSLGNIIVSKQTSSQGITTTAESFNGVYAGVNSTGKPIVVDIGAFLTNANIDLVSASNTNDTPMSITMRVYRTGSLIRQFNATAQHPPNTVAYIGRLSLCTPGSFVDWDAPSGDNYYKVTVQASCDFGTATVNSMSVAVREMT
jgi:hypothetical protein